ncbi:hypothetical protein JTE90_009367 [Oedothorax gibbosus]|uniref:Schwannomin interacting protein 1 C-terminal domain-containing protein n=1 Tax=Oedothorax gibbosus TaxID=931172 RepID=A0AAV6VUX7_9ARAC|nr:hypothetical protein JTE90_009367 [Oedothorax gibbosus]
MIRHEKGWQHLQECSDSFLNNNNNPIDLNDNNNSNEVIVASSEEVSPSFVDGDYRNMSSDDSESSSEDESSESFSDTSPLLDVSSLDNSDVSLDSDMSEDETSSSSSSSDNEEEDLLELEGCDNNNNGDEEDEDVSIADAPSMQSSWMSFSSSVSTPSVAGSSSRGQVVLPDVLPVGKIPKAKDEECKDEDPRVSYGTVATRNLEIKFEKRKSNQDSGASRVLGDRCLVEITAQPDVQVDIRVNPVSSRPRRESRPVTIKHGNTYPREAKNKRYLKNRDINAWIVNDSFDEHYDDRNKSWTLDEGIRLNNFTIVNGQKTLSLTELMNPNKDGGDIVPNFDLETLNSTADIRISKATTSPLTNSYQNFERNYSKLPANVHMCCKDNWRHQKDFKNIQKQKSTSVEVCPVDKLTQANPDTESFSSKVPPQKTRNISADTSVEKSNKSIPSTVSDIDGNSNTMAHVEALPPKPRKEPAYFASRKKSSNSKTSPELFEVYTMETALPQINWAAISKGSRESDWLRKRRNDREEIRRKLAMDSDTEDYISEKLHQHREGSFGHLKSTGNLQICFMNEAAKDQDLSNAEDEVATKKNNAPVPKIQKPSIQLPSTTFTKCEKTPGKPTNNNTVTKRQRPTSFFHRPRSWHASKVPLEPQFQVEEEEDLLTRHTRLQAEAREALAQAKDMARMQMEIERQKKKKSPIADIVGLPFPDGKNLLTYHALVAMNVAQLQVIVNDLHSQIETLNEDLVKFLLNRDDLHMEQDSMLVDIEDLTRYLGLKGSGGVSSSSSQVSVNSASESKMLPKAESVRRSQSVHLKSKHLM